LLQSPAETKRRIRTHHAESDIYIMRVMTVISTFRQAALPRSSWGLVHLICHIAAGIKAACLSYNKDEHYEEDN